MRATERRPNVPVVSWWNYVTHIAGTDSPKVLSAQTGIDSPSFSKWKGGAVPKAETVARFARAYGRPVVEAFVAAKFLEPEEAEVPPEVLVDYSLLTNDELLRLVRSRMEDGDRHDSAAPNHVPGVGPAEKPTVVASSPRAKRGRRDLEVGQDGKES